jgi:hypothetical protein
MESPNIHFSASEGVATERKGEGIKSAVMNPTTGRSPMGRTLIARLRGTACISWKAIITGGTQWLQRI